MNLKQTAYSYLNCDNLVDCKGNMKNKVIMMWIIFAILSAVFAALTSILGTSYEDGLYLTSFNKEYLITSKKTYAGVEHLQPTAAERGR